MNELKSIWVEGGLEGMEIEQTGILVWTPSQSQSGLSVSVKIHAECLLNPEVTCKK